MVSGSGASSLNVPARSVLYELTAAGSFPAKDTERRGASGLSSATSRSTSFAVFSGDDNVLQLALLCLVPTNTSAGVMYTQGSPYIRSCHARDAAASDQTNTCVFAAGSSGGLNLGPITVPAMPFCRFVSSTTSTSPSGLSLEVSALYFRKQYDPSITVLAFAASLV